MFASVSSNFTSSFPLWYPVEEVWIGSRSRTGVPGVQGLMDQQDPRPTAAQLIITRLTLAPGIGHNWILVSGMEEPNKQIAVCLYLFIY